MHLVKITLKREKNQLVKVGEEIIEELPDDPCFFDPLVEILLNRLQTYLEEQRVSSTLPEAYEEVHRVGTCL